MTDEPAQLPIVHAELDREPWTRALELASVLPALLTAAVLALFALENSGDYVYYVAAVGWFALLAAPVWVLCATGLSWLAAARRGGALRLDADGLTLDPDNDPVRIPSSEIALAWVERERRLELFTRAGERLFVDLPEGAPVGPLVDRLRQGIDRDRAFTLPTESRIARVCRKTAFGTLPVVALAALLFGVAFAAVPAAAVVLAYLGARGTRRVRFGADGFEILGRLRRRYVPYRDVVRVEHGPWFASHRVHAILESGERLRLTEWTTHGRARLLAALLEEGRAMVQRGDAAGAHVPSLGRGDDDEAAWRQRVLAAVGAADYRAASLDPERLLALMKNPAADPDQRVAAAIALRRGPGGAQRIRVAAEVSTDPAVRGALDALAEEELDEAQVRRALGALSR